MSRDPKDFHWCDFDGLIAKATERAVCFAGPTGGMAPFWIPRSQLGRLWYADGSGSLEVRVGKAVTQIELPRWLAKERGLM